MITWRTELHFVCDYFTLDAGADNYNMNCHGELLLDQLDAKTKKGMLAIAKKEGWVWNKNTCICPSCITENPLLLPRMANEKG